MLACVKTRTLEAWSKSMLARVDNRVFPISQVVRRSRETYLISRLTKVIFLSSAYSLNPRTGGTNIGAIEFDDKGTPEDGVVNDSF